MGIKCGIVGLPNVGKSTLFNALTGGDIPAENYPFTTIDPNGGIATVPDPRLGPLAAVVNPKTVVPTVVEFVDIAGLVAGASEGEGLGNQFLSHIRETDAIAHVVRCFENDKVVHVDGRIDPVEDITTINTELALPVRTLSFTDTERMVVRDLFLLTWKPTMYIANVAEDGLGENPMVDAVRDLAAEESAAVVVISGALEAELASLPDEDRNEMITGYGLDESGLDKVVHATYDLLGLLTFFTASEKEVRAWTVKQGSTASQAAGAIHTDFERGFIKAEVVAWDDFVELGGEVGARDVGKMRMEGRDYITAEGDVIRFRFNT